MEQTITNTIPVGTRALIFSKRYYGVLSLLLEDMDIERYFSILYFLHYNNTCSQQHLCNSLSVDKTAMVKVMDYLINAGYVAREVNPKDRREHYIKLTRKGKLRTKDVVKSFEKIDKQMFRGVSKKDKDTFMAILGQISERLGTMPSHDLFFEYNKTQVKNKPSKSRS